MAGATSNRGGAGLQLAVSRLLGFEELEPYVCPISNSQRSVTPMRWNLSAYGVKHLGIARPTPHRRPPDPDPHRPRWPGRSLTDDLPRYSYLTVRSVRSTNVGCPGKNQTPFLKRSWRKKSQQQRIEETEVLGDHSLSH